MEEPAREPLPPAQPPAPPTAPAESARRSLLGPYSGVVVYLVGYFAVAMILSTIAAVAAGILMGIGVIPEPAFDLGTTFGVDEVLRLIEPYLLPIVLLVAFYSIAYTWIFVRLIERRPLRTFGLRLRPGWAGEFARGAILAVGVVGVVFVISLVSRSINVEGFARPAPDGTNVVVYLVGMLLAFLAVGFYEELMFRGYVLQRLNERAARVPAIAVSSVIFALMHGVNPGTDVFSLVNTTLIAVLLAVLYFRTGSLWMPIGFHFAWNFSLGYIYSLPVSGIPLHGILNVVEAEPGSRITGGTYGPEAGLACTIALAAWALWLALRRSARRKAGA